MSISRAKRLMKNINGDEAVFDCNLLIFCKFLDSMFITLTDICKT